MEVLEGKVIESSSLPEPVKVLSATPLNGDVVALEGVGRKTGRYYSTIISRSEVKIREIFWNFSGNAEKVFLSLEALRIRNAYLFDPLHAVHISQVDPLPHQMEAVYRYILPQPRIRFLLADDPGAGKTIMAGLVFKELKLRGLVRRTLIIVPGHLQDQWQREMKEKFGEVFQRVNREVMNASWGRNVWRDFPQIITSMDFAKQEDVLESLREAEWDLVIVDEAHKMAAYRYGMDVRKTERYKLGEVVANRCRFLLFLTATPHRGDPENFRLLLNLLEPDFFASTEMLEQAVRSGDNSLFLRRLKEELYDFNGRPLFPPRYVHTAKYRLSDKERLLYNEVTNYVSEHMDKALKANRRNVAFAMLILQRRMASSVRALRDSLERRKERLSQLLKLGKWLLEQDVGRIDWEELEDSPEAERLKQEQELIEKLTNAKTQQELKQEIDLLEKLISMAKELERSEEETKLRELRKVVENRKVRETREKLLVFTESVRTMEYLAEKLREWGFTVTTLHGGMNLNERIRAEHEFRERTQVMVSTEAGGEGINLQFCSLMVNYDIPWSFTRLEQRMGRIHRYGQQKEVHIFNLVTEDTVEGKVLFRVMKKLERARQELGSDRIYDVVGEIWQNRRLEELIFEALARRKTLDEIIAEIEAVPDEELITRIREVIGEALATHHIDMRRIKKWEQEAEEHRLVPEYIEAFFERACSFFGIEARRRRENPKLWQVEYVPAAFRHPTEDFRSRYGEVRESYLRLTFDKETARKENGEFIAPGHPLLEALIEQALREGESELQKGAVFYSPSGKEGFLWFFEGEVKDGTGATAGKRIIALWQNKSGSFSVTDPAILWDLQPAEGNTVVRDEWRPSKEEENLAVMCAYREVLQPYCHHLLEERGRQAEIKRKYGMTSLEFLLAESESKIADYQARMLKGEDLSLALQNEEKRRDDLRRRLGELKEQIERETKLSVSIPKLLTVVRVVPASIEEDLGEDDPEVEEVGMRVAMEYERNQGRIPEDVSLRRCGYDIRSLSPDGQVERYIEVKARSKVGAIALTPNEWLMAQRLKERYWLYIVTNTKTQPELHRIQNPAAKLQPTEKVVRYIVANWQEVAE